MQSMDDFTYKVEARDSFTQSVEQQPVTSSFRFRCTKCSCTEFGLDSFQATGGGFAKAFDVQNKKFNIVFCKQCGYAEMYKADSSTLDNVADFLFNK